MLTILPIINNLKINSLKTTKETNSIETQNEEKFFTTSNNFRIAPNYFNNITFNGNKEIISKMKQLLKNKNYKFEDLEKLFKELTPKVQENVNKLIEKFKNDGLTKQDYLKACVKQPPLFYSSPETIEKNVLELVKKFENDGLNIQDYLKACVKAPSLFYHSPETIEKNIIELVKKFENDGLTKHDYLKTCIKQPSLFCYTPDTIAEHIKAYQYCANNSNEMCNINDITKKNLYSPTSLIYLQGIVLNQIKTQHPQLSNLKTSGIKPSLKEFFTNNPNAQLKIKIKDDEMSENFIKVMQEFSKKDLNRTDAFVYEIVK